jgi:hypothetical protein
VAEDTDDHLFEEIEEDLRAERYAKLWKRYGKFVIAGFIALIVGVAGFKGKVISMRPRQDYWLKRNPAKQKNYLPRSPKTGVKAIGFYLVFAPPPF